MGADHFLGHLDGALDHHTGRQQLLTEFGQAVVWFKHPQDRNYSAGCQVENQMFDYMLAAVTAISALVRPQGRSGCPLWHSMPGGEGIQEVAKPSE